MKRTRITKDLLVCYYDLYALGLITNSEMIEIINFYTDHKVNKDNVEATVFGLIELEKEDNE